MDSGFFKPAAMPISRPKVDGLQGSLVFGEKIKNKLQMNVK
jgi:hypothetical protein